MSHKNKITNHRFEKLVDHIYQKNVYKSTFSYDQLDKIQNHQHIQSSHLQFNHQFNRKNFFKNFLYNFINKYYIHHSKNILLHPPTLPYKIEPTISLKILKKNSKHPPAPPQERLGTPKTQERLGTPKTQPLHLYKQTKSENTNGTHRSTGSTHDISGLYNILENKECKNIVQIQLKYADVILLGVCIMVYDHFLIIKDKDKHCFMKQVKYKMALDLDMENLYEKFNYRYKKFKKTALQNELLENKLHVHNFFYVYLGDYFNLNIIISENDQLNYVNKYDKYRYSILFTCVNGNYTIKYDINSKHNFTTHEQLMPLFDLQKQETKIQKTQYQKLKLGDLQQLVLDKNKQIKL